MIDLKPGIIVSIQGYSTHTTQELATECINAGAVALRLDKPVNSTIPIIGLQKIKVKDVFRESYITPGIDHIMRVREWSDYVAIDYRFINPDLQIISDYCRKEKIPVIADIQGGKDWYNIKTQKLYYTYISTTFSIFDETKRANIRLVKEISREIPGRVIAEGGYKSMNMVIKAYESGARAVCIGEAITGVYKLAQRFAKIDPGKEKR